MNVIQCKVKDKEVVKDVLIMVNGIIEHKGDEK